MSGGAATSARQIAPKQERSRETLERICQATTELLEQRNWPDITVAEIVLRARSSVGSFYARFADKDALLDHLDERYTSSVLEMAGRMAEWVRDAEPGLEEYVRTLVRELVEFHRRSAGLIRALVLRARTYREPDWDERTRRMNEAVGEVFEPLVARMADATGQAPDRRLAERCFFAFTFMFSAMRDRVLFPETITAPEEPTDEVLAEQLATACLAFLRYPITEKTQ